MKDISIEELAYMLKEAKKKCLPQPIFFLGAGASVTGNIPLAGQISKQILEEFADSPFIKKLNESEKTYSNLMACLQPHQRNELLKEIINKAKINVTHIYLAQLLKEGYVDYILTVNFDNLVLRALSLYNIYPSTYDMAILKDLTTTSFKEKSTVYLHGQHHGLWLLNTKDEMDKVKNIVPRVFDSIKNGRPWIFIGYSGTDPIFEHIRSLGRFDNGLYWVGYKENQLEKNVQDFLSKQNTNAFYVKGYDSDAFMLKLNESLDLEQPEILEKPFSSILTMIDDINDIDDEEHFKGVRERLEMAKNNIHLAIRQFENNEKIDVDNKTLEIDKLKKRIIDLIISEDYNEQQITEISLNVDIVDDESLNALLSSLFYNWGTDLGDLAQNKEDKEKDALYLQAFEKFQKAIEFKPDNHQAFNNWGIDLGDLAQTKEDEEKEALYLQAFEKFQKAIEFKPDNHQAFNNWGIDLGDLAQTKEDEEKEALYLQAFEKFQKAIEFKPDSYDAFNNWGIDLGRLAQSKEDKEKDALYRQAFEKFQKAIEFKPDYHQAYNNWGKSLGDLAHTKEDKEKEALYLQAFEKFQKAIEFKSDFHQAYNNWGKSLGDLAHTKEDKEKEALYLQAFEKFQKAIEFKPDSYDAFNNWGIDLGRLAQSKEDKEKDALYRQAFEKFQKAIEFKSDFHQAYNNWGTVLGKLAQIKEDKEKEALYLQAFEKFQKAIDNGGSCYNLSCLYALKNMKKEAFKYLDLALSKQEITTEFIKEDDDWKNFHDDKNFIALLNKYESKK
tara:strand:+ start:20618 stop:22960 length:2343 start_codon:yes stop_codon:yes gene_type:complete